MTDIPTTTAGRGLELPILGRLGLAALGLVVANASLLVVYLIYDATLYQLVLVYWCECLWIGVFSALKLIIASLFGSPYDNPHASVSPGAAVLTSLVVIGVTSATFFSFLGLLLLLILGAGELFPHGAASERNLHDVSLVLGASILLMAGHGLSLIGNFLLLGEFRRARVGALVALPFRRCLALFAAMAAAFVVIAAVPGLATTTGFAVALIGAKLALDVRLHLAERRAFAAGQESAAAD